MPLMNRKFLKNKMNRKMMIEKMKFDKNDNINNEKKTF